jgi:amino acid adenylation domain-containing protein
LFHSEYAPETGVYHDIKSYQVELPFDAGVMEEVLSRLSSRHVLLRTSFALTHGDSALQLVHRHAPMPLAIVDLGRLAGAEREAHLEAFVEEESRRPFEWREPPLLRVFVHLLGSGFQVSLSFHHAILDGWSVATLVTELLTLYRAGLQGAPLDGTPVRAAFRDFVAAEARAVGSPEADSFWARHLDAAEGTVLPRLPGAVAGQGLDRRLLPVTQAMSDRLKAVARRLSVPLRSVLLAAHAKALSILSGRTDVVTGYVSSGRPESPDAERLLGLFLNTLPLRASVVPTTWLGLVESLFRTEQALFPFRRTPLAHITRRHAGGPLFEAVFNWAHFHVYRGLGGHQELPVRERGGFEHTNYPFVVQAGLRPGTGEVYCALEMDRAHFSAEQRDAWAGIYQRVLEALAGGPETRHAERDYLADEERARLTAEWNQDAAAEAPGTLVQRFQEQARRSPHAPALTGEDVTLSYAELDGRANRLARHLVEGGVDPGSRVALLLERSPDLVVAILGVLKAGAAYVPLDPAAPAERIAYTLADAGVRVVVTHSRLAAAGETVPRRVCLDELPLDGPDSAPPVSLRPDDAAYVIYTSGSTGAPKGVVVSHGNVLRLFAATRGWFGFGPTDVWTLFHSYAFDFSVWELWGALLFGGRLVVVPHETSRSPEAFHALLVREGVTVLNQTPSAFRQLIRADEAAGREHLALRTVVFGGEALEPASLRPWFERRGDERPLLVNMYGITETTVHVTYRPIRAADLEAGQGSVIGRAMPGVQVHVLDAHGQLAPVGTPGEIHVGGSGVAWGYLDRPALTAERFVPDGVQGRPGARLYRSGDLARWLPGGELEYLGRADQQIKIRGFRVELGEIESALAAHPGVSESVVVLREDVPGDRRLVAYVVPAEGAELTTTDLRGHLAAGLPDYMVPAAYVELAALPLTVNGKVDRRALPVPEGWGLELGTAYVAPRTPTERVLAEAWAKVLGQEQVGIHDRFFDLGGDSILSISIKAHAAERGVSFTLQELFLHPTVAELALVVDERSSIGLPEAEEPAAGAFGLLSEEDRQRFLSGSI